MWSKILDVQTKAKQHIGIEAHISLVKSNGKNTRAVY